MRPGKKLLLVLSLLQFVLAGHLGAQDSAPDNRWESLMAAGTAAFKQRNFSEAEKQYQAAVLEAEKFGPSDERLATTLNNLATVYLLQKKLAEAEPHLKRSLTIKESAWGPEDPRLIKTLDNLAELYFQKSKFSEAEACYERTLALREKSLGPEHLDIAKNLEDLATVYGYTTRTTMRVISRPPPGPVLPTPAEGQRAARPDEIGLTEPPKTTHEVLRGREEEVRREPLLRRAAAIREKILGPTDPSTIIGWGSLALSLIAQEKRKEADVEIQKITSALRQKPDQPAVVYRASAFVLRAAKRLDEADALDAQAKKLGAKGNKK